MQKSITKATVSDSARLSCSIGLLFNNNNNNNNNTNRSSLVQQLVISIYLLLNIKILAFGTTQLDFAEQSRQ